jgi:hypothetical protein
LSSALSETGLTEMPQDNHAMPLAAEWAASIAVGQASGPIKMSSRGPARAIENGGATAMIAGLVCRIPHALVALLNESAI